MIRYLQIQCAKLGMLAAVAVLVALVTAVGLTNTALAQQDAPTVINGCMLDVYSTIDNQGLNCTANDISIAGVSNINIVDDGCAFPGDTVTFDFTAEVLLTAQDRHDLGIYFALDGDPNGDGALSGQCSISTPPYTGNFPNPAGGTGSFTDLDGTNDDTVPNKFGYCGSNDTYPTIQANGFPQICKNDTQCTVAGETCRQYGPGIQDTCGDISAGATTNPIFIDIQQITVACEDFDNDGQLNLPNCTSWRQPGDNDLCLGPVAAYPGAPSKCRCDPGFEVPIDVPPTKLVLTKTGPGSAAPGDTIVYTIDVENQGPSIAYNVIVTDQLPSDLHFVSATVVNPGGTCSASATPPGQFGGEYITCILNPSTLAVNGTAQIQVTGLINPNNLSVQTLFNTACVEGDNGQTPPRVSRDCDTTTTNTPVTLAFFTTSQQNDGVQFNWSTATETNNIGFNLYVDTSNGPALVNEELIPSEVMNTVIPQDYSYFAPGLAGEVFYIEDIDIWNARQLHGPYALGETIGAPVVVEPVNWNAITAESSTKAAERAAIEHQMINDELAKVGKAVDLSQLTESVMLPLVTSGPDVDAVRAAGKKPASEKTQAALLEVVNFKVSESGVYRISYETLAASYPQITGIDVSALALFSGGKSVPLWVDSADNAFNGDDYIEFVGQAQDTLYTSENVYTLYVDQAHALRIPAEGTRLPKNPQVPAYYMETASVERNREYNYVTPTGDPWLDVRILARPYNSVSLPVSIDEYVEGAAPIILEVDVWGGMSQQHNVTIGLNGVDDLGTLTFDGVTASKAEIVLPANSALISSGVNNISVAVQKPSGAPWDIVNVDQYSLTYPRAFVARNGALNFTASGDAFQVDGLGTQQVVVYRVLEGAVARVRNVNVAASDTGYRATFPGTGGNATYWVYSVNALLEPSFSEIPPKQDIRSGSADYLVIAHPDFINDPTLALQKLVEFHEGQGLTVRVVDVRQVYQQFSHHVFDAQAIHDYIAYAGTHMGVKYVLLVGGDTKDYRGYLPENERGISFVPSLYSATSPSMGFAPVDPLFGDINGDMIPDIAVGRFPVRSSNELRSIVDKTLAYATATHKSAVLASDKGFTKDSDFIAQALPTDWSVTQAYIDDSGVADARTLLIEAMNAGTALVSYTGHSGPGTWSYIQGGPLFSADNAGSLTNSLGDGKSPTVVMQWGCWNNYHVEPAYNTMAHKLLFNGSDPSAYRDSGAAAVLGSSGRASASPQRALGELIVNYLFSNEGQTIGDAMITAKRQLIAEGKGTPDVILGWTLLGDPRLTMK